MNQLRRRDFLWTASAVLGGSVWNRSFSDRALGDEPAAAPAFAATPSFDPDIVLATWQRDPTTTMTIQWIGTEEEGASRPLWFAKDGTMDWKQAVGETRPFPSGKLKVFRTELTGLEPGTDYRFRIGLDSAEKKFRTMPAKATNPITFVSGGDAGIGPATEHSNRIAAAQSPEFVVLGGDLAYENGILAPTFLSFMKNYSKQVVDNQGRLIPLLACLGNHETRGGYGRTRKEAPFFYAMFDGLFTDTGYAALDFGDYLSVVLLDSNHTSPIEGDQTSWLEKTLREREERPTVFVFQHVPSYPSVRPFDMDHQEAGTGSGSRKHWVPVFERYNVDAVFEHHDHAYKRTHPLLDGRVDKNGIQYLGDGSWGRIRQPKSPAERPYLAVAHESYHLSVHRVEGDQRFHVALSDSGKVVDVTMTKKRSRLHPSSSASS